MIRGRFHERVYAIGGKPVLVIRSDTKSALDMLGLIPAKAVAAEDAMELFILGRHYPRHVRANLSRDDREDPDFPSSCGSVRFSDWYGKGTSVHDRIGNIAVAVVPGMRWYHPDFTARGIFRPIIDRMLVLEGYLPFHAAAGFAGGAFLLAGGPGTGKSTLIAAMIRRGAECLGDDRAVVTAEAGTPVLHRFPEYVRLPVDATGPKHPFKPPRPKRERVELGTAVFLEPGDGHLRLERIDRKSVV